MLMQCPIHGYEVLGCDASGDNSKVTSCSADRTVVLWDVGTGQVLRKYRGHISVSKKINVKKINLFVKYINFYICYMS